MTVAELVVQLLEMPQDAIVKRVDGLYSLIPIESITLERATVLAPRARVVLQ